MYCNRSPRSTQPPLHPGYLNRVPASLVKYVALSLSDVFFQALKEPKLDRPGLRQILLGRLRRSLYIDPSVGWGGGHLVGEEQPSTFPPLRRLFDFSILGPLQQAHSESEKILGQNTMFDPLTSRFPRHCSPDKIPGYTPMLYACICYDV